MIRRSTNHLHNKNSARPDPVTSISSNSKEIISERNAIKTSDTFDSLNNRIDNFNHNEHTNTTSTSYHFRFDDGRRSCFGEDNSKKIHKKLGDFHEKQNDVELGRTTGRKSLPGFRDHTTITIKRPVPFRAERNDYDVMSNGRRGGGRVSSIGNSSNTFSMENMNDLGLFVNGDDDHTLFELDDLEDNIDLIVNQKPERSAGPSAYLNHLGTSSHYSDPSSWLKNQDHAFINPDSGTSLRGYGSDNNMTFPSLASNKADSKLSASSTRHKHWTKEEDDTLRNAITQEGKNKIHWKEISGKYFNTTRSGAQCKNRWKSQLQPGSIRGNWNPDEDRFVQRMVLEGFKWKEIAHQLPGRVGESIRERYVNFLDPRLKKTPWTKEEDDILFQNQRIVGNKWTEIRKLLPGRSENSIKNRYHNRKNSHLRRIKQAENEKSKKKQMKISPEQNKEAAEDSVDLIAASSAAFDIFPPPDEVIGI
mmetsp:Transcript_36859/g.42444  ORF Transcript_36859/g.42444 Transcript_36859/m.42444 type:complete len:477 (-) Transcript_36859:355-1785(-)